MNRGVVIKIFAIILSLFLLPFSFAYADDYNYDFETYDIDYTRWFAYDYFLQNGFNDTNENVITITKEVLHEYLGNDITLTSPSYTTTLPNLSFSNLKMFTGNYTGSGVMSQQNYLIVYDKNGNFKGYFAGFYDKDISNNSDSTYGYLMYYNGSSPSATGNTVSICEDNCRLGIQEQVDNSIFTGTINPVNSQLTFTATNNSSDTFSIDLNENYKLLSSLYTKINNGGISGTYTGPTAYNTNQRYSLQPNRPLDFIFIINGYKNNMNNISIYDGGSGNVSFQFNRQFIGSSQLVRISFTNKASESTAISFAIEQLRGLKFSVQPIWLGYRDNMPKDMYDFYYTDKYIPYFEDMLSNQQVQINNESTIITNQGIQITRMNTMITNQNTQITNQNTQIINQETQITNQNTIITKLTDLITQIKTGENKEKNSANQADSANSQMNDTISSYENLESNSLNNMNDSLDSLDISNQNNNLFGNSKFIGSAKWVRDRFNELTVNNAFGYMITFSLVIGLSLTIVGKLRN